MDIKKTLNENELILGVSGRLDTTTAPELEAQLGDNLNNISSLVLDFEGLEYISSAGLRVLLSAQKAMNKNSGSMVINNVCDEIMEVFEITGFSDILTIK